MLLSTALIAGAGISAGASLFGGLINSWTTSRGLDKQIAENRRVEGIQSKERAEDIARSEKWATKEFEATQKQRKFNNAMTARQSLLDMMAQNTQMGNNIISIWRGRRAA